MEKGKAVNATRPITVKKSRTQRSNWPGRKLASTQVTTRNRTEQMVEKNFRMLMSLADKAQVSHTLLVNLHTDVKQIAQGSNEIRSMIAAPPTIGDGNTQGVWMDREYVKSLEKKADAANGSRPHTAEVGKRLDDLAQITQQSFSGIRSVIYTHVNAFEVRLMRVEDQIHEHLRAAAPMPERLSALEKRVAALETKGRRRK